MRSRCHFSVALLAVVALGCGGKAKFLIGPHGEQIEGKDLDATVGSDGSGGPVLGGDDGGTGICKPRTCEQLGANCGQVSDGCGGLVQCGETCPAGQICGGGGPSVCGFGACTKQTCEGLHATCGMQGDGCNNLIDCGSCTAPATCGGGGIPSQCGVPTSCVKRTCTQAGASCGQISDGCGGLLDCGTCQSGQTCGAAGPNVCGVGACTGTLTCADLHATCGQQGDGCGGLIECGTCTLPALCGGAGVLDTCGVPKVSTCTPKTCAEMGFNCGWVADGCGDVVDCGACASGVCGATGKPNVCGGSTAGCTKKTCADVGANCGPVSDGCGGLTENCGTCTVAGETCGGGGTPSVCGSPAVCVPKTCQDYPGKCGQQPDGCGNLTPSCGTCTAPDTCGGGGTPSVCGSAASSCVKKTCDSPEYAGLCGKQADGCGGLTDSCGSCTLPETCGGGGKASKCGKPAECVKKTCDSPEYAAKCGPQPDGCGGLILVEGGNTAENCHPCTLPATCGGGSEAGKCGTSTCQKKTACTGFPAGTCGMQPDGCGGLVDCGGCSVAGETCGGGGTPSLCGKKAECVKKTCASPEYADKCGPQADGCGGLIMAEGGATAEFCNPCTLPESCGGGGTPSVCGKVAASCVKKTCADYSGICGPQSDGCGGLIMAEGGATAEFCNPCTQPDTCGGAGIASKCGHATVSCTPKTCSNFPNTCGPQADGCGGLTADCGGCPTGQICGGGGVPGKCGGGAASCTKKTCADYPGKCGQLVDGCGGVTESCGTCTYPAICGGGGPSVCGTGGGTTCVGLQCKQVQCSSGTTSISGTVYDPAGNHPLPNVNVYVPTRALDAIVTGATCKPCDSGVSGYPLVQTMTKADGTFKLDNMPVDTDVPVVIQLGKWRRQIKVTTSKCADVKVVAGDTHLPRTKDEGNIPKIALTTGSQDALECLLYKIGIADSEFTHPDKSGRVNFFSSTISVAGKNSTKRYKSGFNGAAKAVSFPDVTKLWNTNNPDTSTGTYGLHGYDVVLLGCEGSDTTSNKTEGARKAMQAYVDGGGRVFAEHYHYTWMRSDPNNKWTSMVSWNTDLSMLDSIDETVITGANDKRDTLNSWMILVGGSNVKTSPAPTHFAVSEARQSITAINSDKILHWIKTLPTPQYEQYFTFDTPTDSTDKCGRFVFSDLHVASGSTTGTDFPGGCSKSAMTPQELALEFMFFDLASAVCGGSVPPVTCTRQSCTDYKIECGSAPDGCGGVQDCGTCGTGLVCGTGGKCTTSSCTRTTCAALGYTCGQWPDGCGGALECGSCGSGQTCGGGGVVGKCGGTTCTKTTCAALDHNCGQWPDGCGGVLSCGTCTSPETCGGGGVVGKCGATTCTKATCDALGYTCGQWPDGCGSSLQCGTCATGTCGGGGVPGKCGSATCTKATCTTLGYECGQWPDGCGGSLDCKTCATGTCGGGGVPGKCGSHNCTPTTCTTLGYTCGKWPDGCGGIAGDTTNGCGTCTAPETCGGGGVAGQCGSQNCTPTTCAALQYECGQWPDGCGGTLACGTCTSPETCGGAGVAGQCGISNNCTPTTCSALHYQCGSWPDGCGGTLECGSCPAPSACGLGGVPGVCGSTSCTKKSCADLGVECGDWADGCGGTLSCGTCDAPLTCGGGGVVGKCGTSSCTPKSCTELGVTCGKSGDGCGNIIDCGTCATTSCVPLTCGGRCGKQGDGCGNIITCPDCPGVCVATTCSAAGAHCGSYPDGCGGLLACGTCAAPATCVNYQCVIVN